MSDRTIRLGSVFGCLLCLACVTGSLRAQVVTATIIGHVYDKSGAVIPGAHIVATNKETGYTLEATSDSNGFYALPSLPAGTYSVETSIAGFQTLTQGPITLNSAEQLPLDFTLSPGALQQKIEVQSTAEHIQTQESAVKSDVYRSQIDNMPLNGRNPVALVLLAPSIQISQQASGGSSLGFTINGQNANGLNLRLDGSDNGIGTDPMYFGSLNFNLNMTSVDSIQEFEIQTENYSADVRGSSGYVNVITKSGTNQLHGDFYDFFRNGVLNARNSFQTNRGSLKQNDFGTMISGPIKRDKIFFMGSYEAQRIRNPFPGFATVPTPAFDLTVDPRLQPFLAATPTSPLIPIPGNTNLANFQDSKQTNTRQDLATGRVDFNISEKDRIFVRYAFNDGVVTGASPTSANGTGSSIFPDFSFTEPVRHQTATADWTHSFTPGLLNDLKLGLNRYREGRVRGPNNASLFLDPTPSVPGVTILGGGNDKKFGVTNPEIDDKAVWIKGRSTLSVGGSYEFFVSGQNQLSVITMTFPSLAAFAADTPSSLTSTFGTSLTEPGEHIRDGSKALFIQEDYRATKSLTVNVGLRYDNFGVQTDLEHHALNVISGPFDAYRAPNQPLYNGNNHDFGPRFGFAWKPMGQTPWVVRAGGGIFFGARASGQLGDVLVINNSDPFSITTTDYPNLSFPFTAGLFAYTHNTVGRTAFDPNSKDLYTEQWNATSEYQFGQSTTFTVGYVGNHQVHVPGEYLPNVYSPLLGHRPNTSFGSVKLESNQDAAWYNALQISLRHRLSHNFALDTYYTWGHATGFETGALETSADVGFSNDQVQTYTNRHLSHGNMPFDLRSTFTNDLTYQLPRLAGASTFVKDAFGGWTTAGIFRASSGLPFNLLTGNDSGDQTLVQRPNIVAGQPLTLKGVSPRDGFINRAALSQPTAVQASTGLVLGDMANNSIRMPTTITCDWNLAKSLLVTEKLNLDFRAEVFNIANHSVYAIPTNNMSSSVFGESQSAADPREFQFMLRLRF